jgi:hypothetical protein
MRDILENMKLNRCLSRGSFLNFIESYAAFDFYHEILGVVDVMEGEVGFRRSFNEPKTMFESLYSLVNKPAVAEPEKD